MPRRGGRQGRDGHRADERQRRARFRRGHGEEFGVGEDEER